MSFVFAFTSRNFVCFVKKNWYKKLKIFDGINLLQYVNVRLCLFIICNGYEPSVLMVCDAKSVRIKLISNGRMVSSTVIVAVDVVFCCTNNLFLFNFFVPITIRNDTVFFIWECDQMMRVH